MNNEVVTVPANIMQNIVNYLIKRPFDEVAGIIRALEQYEQEQAEQKKRTPGDHVPPHPPIKD